MKSYGEGWGKLGEALKISLISLASMQWGACPSGSARLLGTRGCWG